MQKQPDHNRLKRFGPSMLRLFLLNCGWDIGPCDSYGWYYQSISGRWVCVSTDKDSIYYPTHVKAVILVLAEELELPLERVIGKVAAFQDKLTAEVLATADIDNHLVQRGKLVEAAR